MRSTPVAALFLLTWTALSAPACKGDGKDPATDDTDTDTPTEDTGGSVDDTISWTEIGSEAVDVYVPAAFWSPRGQRWFPNASTFSSQSTLTPPPELTGDRQLIGRISRAAPFPGSYGVINKAYRDETGKRARTDVTWTEPDDDCSVFDVPLVATGFAVVDPFPSKPRPGGGTELNDFFSCARGVEEGMSCSRSEPCKTGLLCYGLTRGPEGVCEANTLHQVVAFDGGQIPDGSGSYDVDLEVTGLPGTDADVLLALVIDHPRPADLVVTLVNPAAREVTVLNHTTLPPNTEFYLGVPGFSGNDDAAGTWTLRVSDTVNGSSGSIGASRLEVASTP